MFQLRRMAALLTGTGDGAELTHAPMRAPAGRDGKSQRARIAAGPRSLNRLGNTDSLTGLADRRAFIHDLDSATARASRSGDTLAVGRIDLDGFKSVNDIFGYAAGDMILREVARRLAALTCNTVSFARLGGDEFGMLCLDTAERTGARLADAVAAALAKPYAVQETALKLSASIGIANLPPQGCTAAELFEQAGQALLDAKQTLHGLAVPASSPSVMLDAAACVDRALRGADLSAEMYILFQPIVDVEFGHTVAFECLARWNSPELGPIEPTVFIRAAERCSLINRLTEVLLQKSLAAARTWPEAIHISFNLSVHDILSDHAVRRIADIVLASGVAPGRLEFEITETAVMHDYGQARKNLSFLRSLGTCIALDDFGTGYSSLSHVHKLPLDKIKVDRSFTIDVECEQEGRKIVTAVLDLCRILKLSCVVEGLETAPQVSIIKSLGCSLMQGYFFGRPMRQADLTGFLANENRPALAATP